MGLVRAIGAATALLGSVVGVHAETEQAKYRVVDQQDKFELRAYEPAVVAEVRVEGDRDAAVNEGFRSLAAYIFGANVPGTSIAMTAPVTQEAGQRIAMTAPVTQQGGKGNWTVRFIMPAGSRLATMPKPKDARVHLAEMPARRIAAVRFSGLATDTSLADQERQLDDWIAKRKLTPTGPAVFAYYDPPWTLPFLRRNEVLVPVR
ncbi:heme-binding protein [uncultured Alsobacter sp.]|uniref:SOUL family heme-binding protein n=1 Tax=uncultured Alsobacter sp. TaxID=1748258 RepID=UPI0025DD3F5D|nr:heme-binding protein [uncultured Alsobacter sp.]